MMHTKILIRPEKFHLRYQQWQEKMMSMHIEMLRGSYANEVFGKGADDLKFETNSQYSRLTWQPEDIQIDAISCLLDHFKNLLLKNNYGVRLSDERNEVFDNGLKLTIHRHYLKPEISFEELLHQGGSQIFGNLFLEHRFNNQHNTFCISANYYGNKTHHPFEKLMEVLLA